MSRVSMDPEAIYARLKQVSDVADLRPEHRLDSKLDMSPAGVLRRLQIASELRELCNALAQAGSDQRLAADLAEIRSPLRNT